MAPVSPELPRLDLGWNAIREPFGATHPGALAPFGMTCAVPFGFYDKPYETGYPSGYNGRDFYGFGHFAQSGTGTIRWYYNYLLTSPQLQRRFTPAHRRITSEDATPGRYGCTLSDGIVCDAVATPRCILHTFRFPEGSTPSLLIDAGHAYISEDQQMAPRANFPERATIECKSEGEGSGCILMDGHPVHFCLHLTGCRSLALYSEDDGELDERSLEIPEHRTGFGFLAEGVAVKEPITLRIAFSFISTEQAYANLQREMPATDSSARVLTCTSALWKEQTDAIRVEGGREEDRRTFANCMYKAAVKPAYATDENPLWHDHAFFSDFSTVWDMTSTQIPLLLMLRRDIGEQLLKWFIRAYKHYGTYPPAFMMKHDLPWIFSKQASVLGNVILADGFHKGYTNVDWEDALQVMTDALENPRGEAYRNGIALAPSVTHNLDYSYAGFCASSVAQHLGRHARAAELLADARHWRRVYDDNGLLQVVPKDQHYCTEHYPLQWFHFYEGNHWTYSFRIWHNMQGLIDHVGRERFIHNLDRFFGLVPGATHAEFQGLNNEPDYCVPWAYYYAGLPARAQRIVRTALLYQFSPGRDGLPGNDDSGALSAWYIWASIGLFPIAGQDVYLIGSPLFSQVAIRIGEAVFTIRSDITTPSHAFVAGARLNDVPLQRPYLHYHEIAAGGVLDLTLSDTPTDWGASSPPPSHPEG